MRKRSKKHHRRQAGTRRHKKQLFVPFPFPLVAIALVVGFALYYFLPRLLYTRYEPAARILNFGARGRFDTTALTAVFHGLEITQLPKESPPKAPDVLGHTTEERWVEVDLSDQTLRAWEGNTLFLETLVSTGKWGRTPTGEFRVWSKFRYTKMEGGDHSIGTYYYLPNVPFVQFYGNSQVPGSRGYSIHGTYWHNNFGQVMSHGCINLPTDVAEKLFYWSDPVLPEGVSAASASGGSGLRIVVHE